jgi:hypothetical protein
MKRLPTLVAMLAVVAACNDSPTAPPNPSTDLKVGQEVTFNVQSADGKSCTEPDNRTGRVVAISQRAIVVADVNNPTGGFTDDEYRALAADFDNFVYPVGVENFGAPHDVDGNGKSIIFYTRAVNELTPRGQDWYVGGFFFSRDLFPKSDSPGFQGCASSNYAEVFYMLVPDPSGAVHGNARSKEFVRGVTVSTLVHEFQHLINASRRLYVVRGAGTEWNEQVWLNEGLSHIAEELLGYRGTPLAPRQNIDAGRVNSSSAALEAFYANHSANFNRLNSYLVNPDTASLIGPDNLATRGAAWQFLRYAADRKGGSESQLWKSLVDAKISGLANLKSALGADPMEWIREWTVAIYADDAVPGVQAKFTQPSWNFRSIMPAFKSNNGRFPLKTRELANGVASSVTVRGGGAAYLRFGVAPATHAEVRVDPGAAACTASSSPLVLQVGEAFTAAGDAAGALCVSGGTTGAEFVYIPFFASEVASATLALNVTATGVVPVLGSPNPSLMPSLSMEMSVADGEPTPNRAWEMRLREREVRELSRLVPGGQAAVAALDARHGPHTAAASVAAADARLRVTIMRTR